MTAPTLQALPFGVYHLCEYHIDGKPCHKPASYLIPVPDGKMYLCPTCADTLGGGFFKQKREEVML